MSQRRNAVSLWLAVIISAISRCSIATDANPDAIDTCHMPPVARRGWRCSKSPVPVRYHIAVLVSWTDDMDYAQKQYVNGFHQNVRIFVEMLETNSDYNVTRIHTHEFSVLMENTFDLALEVGVGISQKNKQMLGHIPHFVRIQYGHEYRLDQANYIHGAYFNNGKTIKDTKHYSKLDRLWISPHFAETAAYQEALYHTTVRIAPFIWFPRPSLKVHTIADFERGKATSDRSIVICAVNTYTEKSSLLPMVVVNELWKRNPDSFDKVWVVTKKDTFKKNTTGENFWSKLLLPRLEVFWGVNEKAYFSGRAAFEGMFKKPYVLLEHQENWGLNYIYLEALYTKTPIVHNSPYFRDEGYYYAKNNITAAVDALERALMEYRPVNYDEAILRYSPANHTILNQYSDLIEDVMSTDGSDSVSM